MLRSPIRRESLRFSQMVTRFAHVYIFNMRHCPANSESSKVTVLGNRRLVIVQKDDNRHISKAKKAKRLALKHQRLLSWTSQDTTKHTLSQTDSNGSMAVPQCRKGKLCV